MSYRVYRSRAFKDWHQKLSAKEKRIVDARIDIFCRDGILINYKTLRKEFHLYEFKWEMGLRVYFSLLQDYEGNFMLLLQGGNKNSQEKDIQTALRIILKAIQSIGRKNEST